MNGLEEVLTEHIVCNNRGRKAISRRALISQIRSDTAANIAKVRFLFGSCK